MRAWVVVAVTLFALELDAHADPDCAVEAQELRDHLTREARRADTWNTAWGIGFGVAVIGQVMLAHEEINPTGDFDAAYREQMYVGAVKASLGLGSKLVFPLRIRVPDPIRVLGRGIDECKSVRSLRKAVYQAADKERKSILLTIIGGTIVNLSGAMWLWIRQDFTTAAISFATGVPIGPISALTQPRASMKLSKKKKVEWFAGVGWIGGTF
jgi:hypothetical protein